LITSELTATEAPPNEINYNAESNQTAATPPPADVQASDTSASAKPHTGLKVMKKRGGPRPGSGRPRKAFDPSKAINTREAPSRALILPAPPKQWFNKPYEFFDYWKSIKEPDQQSRISVYVYRDWPVCDFRKFDVPGGKKSPVNIDKLEGACPIDPEHWKDSIARLWGSGDYRMMFNELATNRAQCVNISVRDMVNFPPILDLRYLCEDDPQNRDFVRWARSTGRLPSEGEQREDEEMAANAESTKILADTIERMSDKLMEVQQAAPPPPPPPAPISEDSRAAMTGMKMLESTMHTALEMIRNERTAIPDPIESIGKVTELIEKLSPKPAPQDSSMKEFMAQMLAAAERREQEAIRRAERLEERMLAMQNQQHAPASAPKSFAEQLAEFKGMKEVFGDLFGMGAAGGSDADDSPRGGGKRSTMEIIVDALPKLFEHGAVIATRATQMMQISKQGQPTQAPGATIRQAPQPATVVPDPYAHLPPGMRPNANPNPPAQPPATMQPNVIEMPTQPEAPVDGTDPTANMYLQFLQDITPALVNHIQNRLPGDAFAEWLVNSRPDGKMVYAQIVDAGTETLIGLLKQYPPIWNVAQTVPKFFAKFIDEFMEYGDGEVEGEEGTGGAD